MEGRKKKRAEREGGKRESVPTQKEEGKRGRARASQGAPPETSHPCALSGEPGAVQLVFLVLNSQMLISTRSHNIFQVLQLSQLRI